MWRGAHCVTLARLRIDNLGRAVSCVAFSLVTSNLSRQFPVWKAQVESTLCLLCEGRENFLPRLFLLRLRGAPCLESASAKHIAPVTSRLSGAPGLGGTSVKYNAIQPLSVSLQPDEPRPSLLNLLWIIFFMSVNICVIYYVFRDQHLYRR